MIRILFLAANPTDNTRLELNDEFDEISEGLRGSRNSDDFDLEIRHDVSAEKIQNMLLVYRPQIIHFSGHGSAQGSLIFKKIDGNSEEIDPNALSDLFRIINTNKNINCVLLNACFSEKQAGAIAKYVDYVIGMSDQITDRAAIKFAVGFYRALGFGKTIREAFDLGCNQLKLLGIQEDIIPKLLMDSSTGPDDVSARRDVVAVRPAMLAPHRELDGIPQLEIQTDRLEYHAGDTVTISGRFGNANVGLPVLIQIFSPHGVRYKVDQTMVIGESRYSYSFRIGDVRGVSGQYRVVATFGCESEETTFIINE